MNHVAVHHEPNKMIKMKSYLDSIVVGDAVEAASLAKAFCLSSNVSAGQHLSMHGSFMKERPGRWRKVKSTTHG